MERLSEGGYLQGDVARDQSALPDDEEAKGDGHHRPTGRPETGGPREARYGRAEDEAAAPA